MHYKKSTYERRYNLPTTDEISVILPGECSEKPRYRDIILHLKAGNALERISECHPAYLPLHYVLLFPYGELGWHPEMMQLNPKTGIHTKKRLTLKQFHSFRLFQRPNEYSTILRGKNLFQEYLVDAWASTEQNNLFFLKKSQEKLRADSYNNIKASKASGVSPKDGGKPFVLPSSFIGGPRYMSEIYQDSMAITRFHHHPDIFLTMTANPQWPEIQDALLSCQNALDRADLISRVFEMMRVALMKEIKEGNVFGTVVAHVDTIEFQKRGLPHMHALIFLDGPEKIHTIEQVDKFVSVEFPDEQTDPVLFDTVRKCMVHGSCGRDSMCMKNGRCSRGYPKKNVERTSLDEGGYPIYRRRDNGKEVLIRKNFKANNTHVVPYNPYLSRMFNCHINVEVCGGVRAVKYIHKYIYKGHDRATLIVGGCDEVQQYIDARYIGPPEAACCLFGNWMHEEEPTVVRLAIHLPGQQRFVYDPNNPIDTLTTVAENYKSTLMAYFEYYSNNPTAKAYTYQDFPQHFRWNKGINWTPRKRGFAIARMYWVSPNAGEQYYLRLLLTVVAGASSFEDLRTVMDGNVRKEHRTFKAACIALGILGDDREWFKCLEEAAVMKTGVQLRKLFKIILCDCNPTQPDVLWSKFGLKICGDLHFRIKVKYNIRKPTDEQVLDYGLYMLDNELSESGKSLADFQDMPRPQLTWSDEVGDKFVWEHRCLQLAVCSSEVDKNIKKLNSTQLLAYNSVIDSVENGDGKLFFLNDIAGSGKTFLYNTLASSCRRDGRIVLTTASSGIASLLLVGGRTAHSTFKIPFEINEISVCGIDKQDPQSKLLKQVKLIIWDEVPMQHRFCVEAVDRTLRDIGDKERPFGGITVVLGGDFRQTLPIVPGSCREQVVGACLRRSVLWNDVTVLSLHQNMRLDALEPENVSFAKYLTEIGDDPKEDVDLPPSVTRCKDVDGLINTLYPWLVTKEKVSPERFTERVILSARNEDVHKKCSSYECLGWGYVHIPSCRQT